MICLFVTFVTSDAQDVTIGSFKVKVLELIFLREIQWYGPVNIA